MALPYRAALALHVKRPPFLPVRGIAYYSQAHSGPSPRVQLLKYGIAALSGAEIDLEKAVIRTALSRAGWTEKSIDELRILRRQR